MNGGLTVAVYECRMPYCTDEVYAPGEVCDGCWDYRLVELRALPNLYVRVYAQLEPGSKVSDISQIHVENPEPGAPINLAAFDALQWAYASITVWARYAAQLHGHRFITAEHTTGAAFVDAIEILLEYDSRFATRFEAGDYVDEVHRVYRGLVRLAAPAPTRVIATPCPHCDAMTLVARNAEEYAACLTCHNMWAHSRIPNLNNQSLEQAS